MNSLDRKKRIRDAMGALSQEQLDQLALWRDQKVTLQDLAKRCEEKFTIKVSVPTLCRWDRDRKVVDLQEDTKDLDLIARDINHYAATGECGSDGTGFHSATVHLIEKQALELALDQSDHDRLKDLFRMKLAHENAQTRKTYTTHRIELEKEKLEHRKQINTERLALDHRKQSLREKQFEHQKSIDEKKFAEPEQPKPLTPEERQERIWNIFCIPEEERARRRAKSKAAVAEQNQTAQPESNVPTCAAPAPCALEMPNEKCSMLNEKCESNPSRCTHPVPVAQANGQSIVANFNPLQPSRGNSTAPAPSAPKMPNEKCSLLNEKCESNPSPTTSHSPHLVSRSEGLFVGANLEAGLGSQPTPSCPLCSSGIDHLSSDALAKRADTYTALRTEEYSAHRRAETAWFEQQAKRPDPGILPPVYTTRLLECPCGCALPCTHHREFTDHFWKVSPYDLFYRRSLQDRGIPYREPKEFCV